MIQINLLKTEVDNSGTYALQVGIFFGSLLLMLGGCFALYGAQSSKLSSHTSEKRDLDIKLSKLKKTTEEVEGLEDKKKLLKQKLLTIAKLKANKYGPVRVLDDLNMAIPERAWLQEIGESSGTIEIEGIALDDQTVSRFMVDLEKSSYFKDVDLQQSVEHEKDNVLLRSFSLRAKVVGSLEAEKDKDKEKEAGPDVPEIK